MTEEELEPVKRAVNATARVIRLLLAILVAGLLGLVALVWKAVFQ